MSKKISKRLQEQTGLPEKNPTPRDVDDLWTQYEDGIITLEERNTVRSKWGLKGDWILRVVHRKGDHDGTDARSD